MATLSITVPDPQVPRVQTAIGFYLGLGRDATADEVRGVLVNLLTQVVRRTEADQAALAAEQSFTDIGATL